MRILGCLLLLLMMMSFAHDVLCFNQVETIQQYFPVFDKLRKEFFVGELIWNFADFMTKQREIFLLFIATFREGEVGGGGGNSHIKITGVLV